MRAYYRLSVLYIVCLRYYLRVYPTSDEYSLRIVSAWEN